MSTNIPLTGIFRVTCEYKRKGNWTAGWHTGIDLYSDNQIIYGTCDGVVHRTGYDKSYGNYIVVRDKSTGKYHWFCHLSKITCSVGQEVSRVSKIGVMGSTGNSTGTHLHYEIRNESNSYADTSNPAEYMRIPNQVGTYNTEQYQNNDYQFFKTLARTTNLRDKPTTEGSNAVLYLANTTLYVIEPSVAIADGYTWDYVEIRVNKKRGYMINCNYK